MKTELIRTLINAREKYINIIKSELLGPGSEFHIPDKEHELISSSPVSRYSIGILYPQGNHINLDDDETIPIIGSEDFESNIDEEYETTPMNDKPIPVGNKINHNYESAETTDGNLSEEIALSAQYMPSSIGISFTVKGDTDSVSGSVSFATYRQATITDCLIPSPSDSYSVPHELAHIISYHKEKGGLSLLTDIKKKDAKDILDRCNLPKDDITRKIAYRFADLRQSGHVREPHNNIEFTIDFSNTDFSDNNKGIDGTNAKITALRTKLSENTWSLTIMLVNDIYGAPVKAENCLYQPVLYISSTKNRFTFTESPANIDFDDLDDEERSMRLLYRDKKIYGTGLGVCINSNIDDSGSGSIRSDFFPTYEVPQVNFDLPFNENFSTEHLSMKYLSDLDHSDKRAKLTSLTNLIDLYKTWVDDLETKANNLDPLYASTANKNISACKQAYERMYHGIEILKNNDNAYSAFALANRAMFMQRMHLQMQKETSDSDRYPGDQKITELLHNMEYDKKDNGDYRWRPFQIAFLLMVIGSIVYGESPEHDIVDLIWFPTGGGKTEAYLGLTAFTIFYRKLVYPENSGGTSIIMRYTLRLLTAQQFTRAATLICACEYIRRDCMRKNHVYPSYSLGEESITIGLWIGNNHIPNKNSDAKQNLNDLRSARGKENKDKFNKFQVLKCPWCGTKLTEDDKNKKTVGAWGYSMRDEKHFYIHCVHEDCPFTDKLPIQIIDEELYLNPPSLLFATVDKFAMLPWDGRIGSFFGINNHNRSPELIIQDELHLISGALGSIVGLYETAVDALCSLKGVRPKIIASTATIRKAKEQCSVLYNRDVVQFPPPGLNAGDSFFSSEAIINHEKGIFGRTYIGLMPSGKTKAMMEIRTLSSLLQRIHIMDLPDEIKDKLWTLTVYFNSLRDLGKASTLLEDDVKDFIIRIANRMFKSRRIIVGVDELTSRVKTIELNKTLDKLENLEYSKTNIADKRYASNVLLATNMISVGIDLARLNVMLIVGQPKLTSEYIQVSSRIGRSYPGVAFVQFDATKSRDRSHYERFVTYHESLYRFVEPTGATPFSKPARERALHAIVTSIIRQRCELYEDGDAIKFDRDRLMDIISETEKFIINRIKEINMRSGTKLEDNISDIEKEIQEFIARWQKMTEAAKNENTQFDFGRKFMTRPPTNKSKRLLKSYKSHGKDDSIETLTSMRNVDTQVEGEIMIWNNHS